MKNVLVCSLATQGYHWQYSKNLQSQRAYAQRFGYAYSVVERPLFTTVGLDVVWMKLYMLQEALRHGYSWVMYVDADAKITRQCPAIETVAQPRKSIYMANGYSGRFNSGVILLKNDRYSQAFIKTIIAERNTAIPEHCDVGWGENGHIIYVAQKNTRVQVLDQRWNNNASTSLADYIRHYSAGPLRCYYRPHWADTVKFRTLKLILSCICHIKTRLFGTSRQGSHFETLHRMVEKYFYLPTP